MTDTEKLVPTNEEQAHVNSAAEPGTAAGGASLMPDYVTTKFFYQVVIVVSLVTSIISLVVYDRFFATKIATFDFPGYLISVREKMALATSSADAEKVLMSGLNSAESIIKGVPRNYVVISGDAVLGDSKPVLVLYRYPKKQQASEQAPAAPGGQTQSDAKPDTHKD